MTDLQMHSLGGRRSPTAFAPVAKGLSILPSNSSALRAKIRLGIPGCGGSRGELVVSAEHRRELVPSQNSIVNVFARLRGARPGRRRFTTVT